MSNTVTMEEGEFKDWASCGRVAKLLGWKCEVTEASTDDGAVGTVTSLLNLDDFAQVQLMFLPGFPATGNLWEPGCGNEEPDFSSNNPADVARWICEYAPAATPVPLDNVVPIK